jgi:16S rRNA (adenine1518-N6/adenine1519-N6)-dimethyltransferase
MKTPDKSLGQHWLFNKESLEAMAEAGQIEKGDDVLEIGPGLGTLTTLLLGRGASVTAVEFDDSLADELPLRVKDSAGKLQIIKQDILKFNLNDLPKDYKVCANIPYYLTSHLLRLLSESTNRPSRVALLVQKEVAERVSAKPGQMSLLSVSTQMYFEVAVGRVVPANLFLPPPKVDSQILILTRRAEPLFNGVDERQLFKVVKAGFSERRKKLRSSLSGGLGIPKAKTDELLQKAGIDSNLRAQNLSLQDWLKLTATLGRN